MLIKYFALILLVFSNSCTPVKYGKAIKADAEINFSNHKKFFRTLQFRGIVTNKAELNNDYGKSYRLFLKVVDINKDVFIGNVQYSPYYTFDSLNAKTLKILVNNDIFKNTSIDDTLLKSGDSITVKNIRYLFLSKEERKWIE